jgi:hypothetical protein
MGGKKKQSGESTQPKRQRKKKGTEATAENQSAQPEQTLVLVDTEAAVKKEMAALEEDIRLGAAAANKPFLEAAKAARRMWKRFYPDLLNGKAAINLVAFYIDLE